MFRQSGKLIVLVCLCFLMVLMIASGQVPPPVVIDLDKGEEDIRILGDDVGDTSGNAVASGDINGDGYDDLIIGARETDPEGGIDAGQTYVVFGNTSFPSTINFDSEAADMTIYGAAAGDWSGQTVHSGDINGDGYDDVIIGAYYADPAGRTDAGETYVIFGNPSPPKSFDLHYYNASITIYGDDADDWSGNAVASGDINSDGYDDVIIGAYKADPESRTDAGETYVIFGSASPTATIDLNSTSADMTIYGNNAGDCSGRAVSSGDINGDGYDDVIIGAYYADPAGRDKAGEAYVIFGSSSPPSIIDLNSQSADMTIYGKYAYDEIGSSVASGDINGDGYNDVIIGAWYANTINGENSGATYVIFGSLSPPASIDLNSQSADITIYGDDAYDASGFAVASGDINDDGYDDVIIGAWRADPAGGTDAGETYVIFGSISPPTTIDLNSESADITIYGDDAGDHSGCGVSNGDINGDGYDDVIIGAYEADPTGGANAGETYVILGNTFIPSPIISGLVKTSGGIGIGGVELSFSDGDGTATTASDGTYSHEVPWDWSGTVTPGKIGYSFNPSSLSYTNLTSDQIGQDYTASIQAADAFAAINYLITNTNSVIDEYGLTRFEGNRLINMLNRAKLYINKGQYKRAIRMLRQFKRVVKSLSQGRRHPLPDDVAAELQSYADYIIGLI